MSEQMTEYLEPSLDDEKPSLEISEQSRADTDDSAELVSWPMQASAETEIFEAAPELSDAYARAREYLRHKGEHSSSEDMGWLAEAGGNMEILSLAVVATNTPKDVKKYREIIETLRKAGEGLTVPEKAFDDMIDKLKRSIRGRIDDRSAVSKIGLGVLSGVGTAAYEANNPQSPLINWLAQKSHHDPVLDAVVAGVIVAGTTGKIVKESRERSNRALQAEAQFRLDSLFKK